ncbi:hypothetical protein H632_c340p3 [Helicosporidium sp. ATCC 50920]|nr:hypothetical protein H632_c340p3 [Helicosporidium sp. ATCC 50920]|eukprot:KDD76139.1 hypothetical protein H632_c340p3 [Helicosporidium sp. ATCC 50920]
MGQKWTKVARLDRKSLLTVEHFIRTARAHNAPDDILRWLVDRIQGENAIQRRAKMLSELGHEAEARALLAQQSTAGRIGTEGGVLGSLRDTLTGGMGSIFQRVGAPRG